MENEIKDAIISCFTKAIVNHINAYNEDNIIENKIHNLMAEEDKSSSEVIEELIQIDIEKKNGFSVHIKENISVSFETTFNCRNSIEAIKTLGKEVHNFASINVDELSDEEIDFYLRIWHVAYLRDYLRNKVTTSMARENLANFEIGNFEIQNKQLEKDIELLNLKIKELDEKFGKKNKKDIKLQTKIDNLNMEISIIKKTLINNQMKMMKMKEEKLAIKEHFSKLKESVDNPVFIIDGDKISIEGFENIQF